MHGGIFWGDGTGDFFDAEHTTFPRPGQDWSISSGDLLPIDIEGDKDLDLVVGYDPSTFGSPAQHPEGTPLFIQILVNKGNRQFIDESAVRVHTPATSLFLIGSFHEVDFNSDSCPDFLVEHAGWYWNENLYLNDCSGRFAAVHPAVLGKLRQILPIDAHGDGDLDFVCYRTRPSIEDPGDFAILEKVRPYITTIFRDGFESGDTTAWSSTQ